VLYQKLSKFSKTCFTTTKETALAPFNLAHPDIRFGYISNYSRNKIMLTIKVKPWCQNSQSIWKSYSTQIANQHFRHSEHKCVSVCFSFWLFTAGLARKLVLTLALV